MAAKARRMSTYMYVYINTIELVMVRGRGVRRAECNRETGSHLRAECAKGRDREDWNRTLRSACRVYIEWCLTDKAAMLGDTGRANT